MKRHANISCPPLFFWADSSSQPHLYPYCSSAKILFVCTMFTFTSLPAKTAANSGGSSGYDGQDVANMSRDQMRALLAQQKAALATLQTKPDELNVNDKSGAPELTATAVVELMAKPKLASWMRQCGDALGDYVCTLLLEVMV